MTAWLFLWLFWFLNEALSAAFVVCALITFRNVNKAKQYTHSSDTFDVNAVLAALFLGVVIAILFFVVSLVILLKNAVNHEALSGFGNGILLASSFHTSIFSLLTALVVYSAKNLFSYWERNPNVNWNASNTAAFDATYVLAFLMAGTYLVYSVLILVLRNVFVRDEAAGRLATPASDRPAAAPAAAAGTPAYGQTPGATPFAEPTKTAPTTAAPAKRGWFSRKPKNTAATEPGLPTTAPAAKPAAAPANPSTPAAPTPATPAAAEAPAPHTAGAWSSTGNTTGEAAV